MSLAFLVWAGPDNYQKKLGVLKSLWTMFPEDHELVLVRDSFRRIRRITNRRDKSGTERVDLLLVV
jgi:hypothetical protein